MPEFNDQQKALVVRAINTEINLLRRLYGREYIPGAPKEALDWWESQIDELQRAIALIYPDEEFQRPIAAMRCGSGWTGDRCTFPLHHPGPHSNEDKLASERRSAHHRPAHLSDGLD